MNITKSVAKIDLSLIKKCVSEIELTINNLKQNDLIDKNEVFIELAKLLGIMSGCAQESNALIMDVAQIMKTVQSELDPSLMKEDYFGNLMQSFKLPKNNN